PAPQRGCWAVHPRRWRQREAQAPSSRGRRRARQARQAHHAQGTQGRRRGRVAMNRALLAVAATVLLASVRRALPVMLGVSSVPFTPGSVVVAYAALTKPPIEAAITASLCGLVVDGLSGIPLGVSSFAL